MRAQRMTRQLHLLRAGINRAAFGGEQQAIGEPVKQAEFKIVFEPLYAAQHRGRAGAQRRRGLAEARRARDRNEHAQIVPRNALEQRSPDGVFRFCTDPLRKFCHRPEYPLAMLLYGGQF